MSDWKMEDLVAADKTYPWHPGVADLEALTATEVYQTAAVLIESIVQDAAGIKHWPPGIHPSVRNWVRSFYSADGMKG